MSMTLENKMQDEQLNKKIDERVKKLMTEFSQSSGFTVKKITDTPTDNLQVVNRKYVTLNGLTASRPPNPVIGQFYFDTALGFPIWYSGSDWVDATGTSA